MKYIPSEIIIREKALKFIDIKILGAHLTSGWDSSYPFIYSPYSFSGFFSWLLDFILLTCLQLLMFLNIKGRVWFPDDYPINDDFEHIKYVRESLTEVFQVIKLFSENLSPSVHNVDKTISNYCVRIKFQRSDVVCSLLLESDL